MTQTDERLLEFLCDFGPHSPTEIVDDGRVAGSRQHINTRLRMLEDAEFLQTYGSGVYAIDDDGEDLLTGDLDGRGMPEPDD